MNHTFDSYDHEQLKRMPYGDFLQTGYWKAVSQLVRTRDSHKCRICNSKNRLEVHHRSYAFRGMDHEHMDELTTLCHTCHNRHHFPPAEKIVEVVKTVTKYVSVPEKRHMKDWREATPDDRIYFRQAAEILGIKAKRLFTFGREDTHRRIVANQAARNNRALRNQSQQSQPQPQPQPQPPQQPRPSKAKSVLDGMPRFNGYVVVGDLTTVDTDMPDGETIVMTREILNKCRANGSLTTATVKAFSIAPGKLLKGWAQALIGQTFPRSVIYEAMKGRHLYSPETFKQREKTRLRGLFDENKQITTF